MDPLKNFARESVECQVILAGFVLSKWPSIANLWMPTCHVFPLANSQNRRLNYTKT